MPPLSLLSQRAALDLAKQATEDFPGLDILLQPVIRPRPLTDDLVITGWVLIVTGPGGRSPWFELRDEIAYDSLCERVYAQYEAAIEQAVGAPPLVEAEPDPALVDGVPPLAVVQGKKKRRASP